ncbi:hypothetical protein THRCLA_08931 [Thraustotheca clavata]|uniref:Uncharacterized protein n=1 Tax=Thraustotheca clavata TaxID=74557 RepID=A0A1V9Z0Y4_9STRA|nr:hypothetical protein THRCLA_08931 [Thraustotheca clavata]
MATKWNWAELCTKKESKPAPAVIPEPKKPKKKVPAANSFTYTNISRPQPSPTAHLDEKTKFGFVQVPVIDGIDMISAEEFSSLRVKDRLISSEEMREHMQGRTNVRLADLESKHVHRLEKEQVDWVTIGVVTKASVVQIPTGGQYLVWTLSDLDNCMISLFLYNQAYEAYRKEREGQLIAVINPTILPAREQGQFSLKVTSPHEIAKIGTAMDFGFCQSFTHGGRQCKIAVNMAKSRYCVIHLAQRLKDAGKGRQALNSSQTFRSDIFKGGDSIRNISSGSYGLNMAKKKPVDRKRKAEAIATTVTSVGDITVEGPKKTKPIETVNFKPSTLDDLKASLKNPPANASNRGQQSIIAKMLGISSKPKNINLMQYMTKHTTHASIPNQPSAQAPILGQKRKKATHPASLRMTTSSNPRAANVTSLRATGMFAFDTPSKPSVLERK